MQGLTLEFGLISWFGKFLNFFATEDEDDKSDKTDKNEEDDAFDDDLEDAFSDDEDENDKEDDKGDDDEEDDEDDTEGDDKKKDDKKSNKESSAIIQKKKYREALRVANAKIKELEGKKDTQGQLTEEQKKELAAKEYLAKTIKEILNTTEKEKAEREAEALEKFEEEIEAVLEEHSDIKEKQIRDVCEELEVSPKQAVKIIQRESKLKGKEKPKMPQPKRARTEVDEDDSKKEKKRLTLDEINRNIKEKIRKGLM